MTNKLKCEYLESSPEPLTTNDDAKSAMSACSQGEETASNISSDPNEVRSGRHDAATERAMTGEYIASLRADGQVPSGKVETDEGPGSDVKK
jgi:hypothetical protein